MVAKKPHARPKPEAAKPTSTTPGRPELIMHIGTTKTGSTSIQHRLVAQKRNLPAQGAYFAATPSDKGRHIMLATAFTSYNSMTDDAENTRWEGEAPTAKLSTYLAQFTAEMNALPAGIKRVILSAEQFSMYVRKPADIARLRDFLAPFFSKMTIVVYLRRQDSHFASVYSEFLRFGDVHEPDMTRLRVFHHNYDYASFVGRWAAAFGEANVRPRIFERTAGKSFDVVQDFFELCGLDATLKGEGPAEDRNVSMNRAGQQLLIALGPLMQVQTGKRVSGGTAWNRICANITAIAPGRGWEPTRAQAAAFMQRYAASNEALRARWFPERERVFSDDMSALPETEVPVPLEEALRVAQAALMHTTIQGIEREQRLLVEKAHLAERAGDQKARKHALVQAVRCNGEAPTPRVEMARLLFESGDVAGARVSLGVALRVAPTHPGALALKRQMPQAGQLRRPAKPDTLAPALDEAVEV